MATVALTRNGKQLFGYDSSKEKLIGHLKSLGFREATEAELAKVGYIEKSTPEVKEETPEVKEETPAKVVKPKPVKEETPDPAPTIDDAESKNIY